MSHPTTPLSKSPLNPPGSPISSPSKAAVITKLAQLNMPKASSPAKPLATPQPPDIAISKEEIQLLEGENPDKARELFNAILDRAKNILFPALSIVNVTCKIGIALTYGTGSSEREQWVSKAKEDIDKVFANKASWNISETEVIETYQFLRNSLEHLRLLMPPKHTTILEDIKTKLEECQKNIPQTIEDFNPLVELALLCASLKDNAKANEYFTKALILISDKKDNAKTDEYFTKALVLISDKKESPCKLAKAEYLLKFAAIYPIENSQRTMKVLLAQDAVFALEGIEVELCPDQSRLSGMNLLRDLLKRLLNLTPLTLKKNRLEINEKLKTCENELVKLTLTARLGKLFAFFAFVCVFSAVATFYRRYIVRIN